jgi:hypothetical protein
MLGLRKFSEHLLGLREFPGIPCIPQNFRGIPRNFPGVSGKKKPGNSRDFPEFLRIPPEFLGIFRENIVFP